MKVENNTPKTIVLDASAVLAYILPDERTPKHIIKVFKYWKNQKTNPFSPPLLKSEVGNTLKSSVKRKRLTPKTAQKIYNNFLKLPITYITPNLPKTLILAIKHNLSFYDALYLSLSLEKSTSLVTLDKKLAKLS
jgi:predicted nucleic acid-binding protein